MSKSNEFNVDSENKGFDLKHRNTIAFNITKYDKAVESNGKTQFIDWEKAREQASSIKQKVLESLPDYLEKFENRFTQNGGKVLWAENGEEALLHINSLLNKVEAKSVVKSKSMTTEEIHFNEALEARGVEPVETDLGEFIVQLAGQKPYHIVTPAMHMSKTDVAELFVEKLQASPTNDAQELTLLARQLLRQKYTEAEVGVTGGNFLIAEEGGIALTENEGNARLSFTFPKVHIAIVGIEKVLPSMDDLALFWPLLATSGTGQLMTVYNSIITGPRKESEVDGPEEMFVILLDNGRSTLYNDVKKRQSLACIRCGACLNACPVYKSVGGHTYSTTYSGPIGSVITPHFEGMKEFKHLSYASSLCGACTSVCPVKINLHELLVQNRNQAVKEKKTLGEDLAFKAWKKGMMNRNLMNSGTSKMKQYFLKQLFSKQWGRREIPTIAKKSFNSQWKKKKK